MNKQTPKSEFTYKESGVDIDAGNHLVELIKPLAKATQDRHVLAGVGGFSALYELPKGYENPILVSSTDGVGTKLKLAQQLNNHETLGIDLVAMCINDIITCGADPLFFLDYYATGKLKPEHAAQIIKGISLGCQEAEAALVGGETAEMPGLYRDDDYDIAGFCVGVVDKMKIIDGSKVAPGDSLIGIASSGPHANGYSLIRKIIETNAIDLTKKLNEKSLGELLITPTRIYVKAIKQLKQRYSLLAIAHITGGGIMENLPRVLPDNVRAIIQKNAWKKPPIFEWLQTEGNIHEQEMLRTFNCGIGMIICIRKNDEKAILQSLQAMGETAFTIGTIEARRTGESAIQFSM